MEHKMHDMGKMENRGGEISSNKSKKEKHYPSFSISSEQMPELKGKKYGDSIEMHIKGEVEGMHEDYDNKKEAEYRIKIMECGMMDNSHKEDNLKKKMAGLKQGEH